MMDTLVPSCSFPFELSTRAHSLGKNLIGPVCNCFIGAGNPSPVAVAAKAAARSSAFFFLSAFFVAASSCCCSFIARLRAAASVLAASDLTGGAVMMWRMGARPAEARISRMTVCTASVTEEGRKVAEARSTVRITSQSSGA